MWEPIPGRGNWTICPPRNERPRPNGAGYRQSKHRCLSRRQRRGIAGQTGAENGIFRAGVRENHAEGRTRTGTGSPPLDFESSVSANFTTPAWVTCWLDDNVGERGGICQDALLMSWCGRTCGAGGAGRGIAEADDPSAGRGEDGGGDHFPRRVCWRCAGRGAFLLAKNALAPIGFTVGFRPWAAWARSLLFLRWTIVLFLEPFLGFPGLTFTL